MSKQALPRARPKPVKPVVRANHGVWSRLKEILASPVDGASLAAFRVAVGLVMALEAYALCRPNVAAISAGTTPLETYYTGVSFHLPYPLFAWLPLLPAPWIYAIVGLLAVAGLTMAAGLWYRTSAVIVFLTSGYLWAVESTRTYWQSHYYLELLLTFLMIWMPAARRFSVDHWLSRKDPPPATVPFWTIFLLRGQLLLAYFYAGVAKLSADWLLDAAPIRWVLTDPSILKPYARFFTPEQLEPVRQLLHSVGFAYFICWTGLFFDLAVGFLLLARRTRLFGLALMVIFHGLNHFIIFDDIGWFPLVGVTTALIFLNPDWPVRFGRWLRQPYLPRPDWNWFAAGGILFPVVGATLGWQAKPPQPLPAGTARYPLASWTLPLIVVWLVWQGLMPLRHYAIAGDGRFTYEGMSFSWRLKAEARHAQGHHLFIRDPAIIAQPARGLSHINWSEWHGDKVVYRRVSAGAIDWPRLPELIVLLEPLFGERIFYNLAAAPEGARTESAARERITALWQALYGRNADAIRPAASLPNVFRSAAAVLRASGGAAPQRARAEDLIRRLDQIERGELAGDGALNTVRDIRTFVSELLARPAHDSLRATLDPLQPFAIEGRPQSATLFVIEDKALFRNVDGQPRRLDPTAWKQPPSGASRPSDSYSKDATVIHVADIGVQAKDLLPQTCIFDSQDVPAQPPFIWWNSVRHLSPSKGIHVSIQAFFLRRYAQRVAALWEQEYGRRPIINAGTAVSLNGRRHQELVDPAVDLASVPVSYFRHNRWIRDLEEPRIPRELLAEGRRPPGF